MSDTEENYTVYTWRGLMLDCSRHFMPIDFIKHILDLMAELRMNRFHWHLSDDQGWRLPIKDYPRLTSIGAWRVDKGKILGGYYRESDIRDIVSYAAKRDIIIIPEIDIPGHCSAALAAYPGLGCPDHKVHVRSDWGIFDAVFCAGSSEVQVFLHNIFETLIDLFPSPWIHIGGDEVSTKHWESCPLCQKTMRDQGMSSEKELYLHLLKPVCELIRSRGRQVIGWEDVMEFCPNENVTIMSWRGEEGARAAQEKNRPSILCPHDHFYLDYPASENDALPGANWMPLLPIEKIHSYKPPQLDGVIGLQCNLWTEYTPRPEDVLHRLIPRLDAVAQKCLNL